jgi:hypothetical protein
MGKVLSAEGSGYFPSCIQTAPESKSNLVGGTLEQIMQLYWRVKSWKLESISGSLTFFDPNGDFTLNYSASQQSLGSVDPATEENLVCDPFPFFSAQPLYTLSSPSGSETYSLDIVMNGLTYNFLRDNETYYMAFYFDMAFVTTQETAYQVGSVEINGLSVPLYGYRDGQPPTNITGNIFALISPAEYWSYGGTYDTLTGVPL